MSAFSRATPRVRALINRQRAGRDRHLVASVYNQISDADMLRSYYRSALPPGYLTDAQMLRSYNSSAPTFPLTDAEMLRSYRRTMTPRRRVRRGRQIRGPGRVRRTRRIRI